jgi:hypothetical protein
MELEKLKVKNGKDCSHRRRGNGSLKISKA